MTSLGKLLVYINTFAAVILFGWAVSLYSNRVEWFDRTVEETKIEGQITQLQAEVKRLSELGKGTQAAYAAAVSRSTKEEQTRDFRQFKFDERLKAIRSTGDNVLFKEQKRLDRSALIDVNNDGPTVNGLNGKPLKGLGALRKEYDDLTRKSYDAFKKIDGYRTEVKSLNEQIDVIQAEVLRQKLIWENLKDEQEYLFDARINWEEQLRTLELRKAQLEQRIASFGK